MTSRRDLIRASAVGAAAAAAGMHLPTHPAGAQDAAASGVKWSKAPCRFCGTGCGVAVGVKDGRVIATEGDPKAEVNRGLNCVKGYFLSKILYGGDRLTTPLLRKKDGRFAKDGDFVPVSWDEAFDVMAEQFKRVLRTMGGAGIGMAGSGQWTVWEGYAANKLMKAGFRVASVDTDTSGDISLMEAQVVWPDLTEDAYKAADLDQSGSLSQEEYEAYLAANPPAAAQ